MYWNFVAIDGVMKNQLHPYNEIAYVQRIRCIKIVLQKRELITR
jgi:hypothetical protein